MENDDEVVRRPGRPQSPRTRLTQEAIKQAQRTGLLPHEILLDMARGMPQRTLKYKGHNEYGDLLVEEEWVELTVEERKDAAKAAAPYYAPKLSTVETVQGLADDDLDALIKQLATQTGFATGAGGEGQTEPEEEGSSGSSGARTTQRRRVHLD